MRAKKIGQPHLGDYIKGSGIAHPTKLHKHSHTKSEEKKKDSKRKLSIPVLNNGKPKLTLSCLIIYILFHPLKKHKANQRF